MVIRDRITIMRPFNFPFVDYFPPLTVSVQDILLDQFVEAGTDLIG